MSLVARFAVWAECVADFGLAWAWSIFSRTPGLLLNSWSNGCPTLVCLLQLTFYAQNVGGSLTLHADTVPSNTLHRDLWCYTWATDDWSFTLSQSVVLHTSPSIASGVRACACMLACVCVCVSVCVCVCVSERARERERERERAVF